MSRASRVEPLTRLLERVFVWEWHADRDRVRIRHERGARSLADALIALQRFCDGMLSAHAAHLRTRPREADTVELGWIDCAAQEFSRLSRVRVASMRAVPKLLVDAATALHWPHHAG